MALKVPRITLERASMPQTVKRLPTILQGRHDGRKPLAASHGVGVVVGAW